MTPLISRRSTCVAALLALAGSAFAQANYPNRPITLIVPYAAGGSSDARARQVAQKISGYLGQQVIVDNKPGGNGNIGTAAIAKAAPDGYTIGIGNLAPLTVNRTLMPSATPFDAATDLVPVVLLERGPLVLVVNEKSPYKSAKQLVDALKAQPTKFSYASAGSGGAFHLAGELFKSVTATTATHIPYKGGGPAMNDMLSGQVDYMFEMVPSALGYLTAQPPKLRALAVATEKRLPSLPEVPTFAEQGISNMVISNWFGIVAPKGTPKTVVDKLNEAVNRALREPDLLKRITDPGNVVGGGSPAQFAEFINGETARWTQLIKEKGIQAE
ncbi:tripartite tricarboxylate transporter substrate binding protein [Ramlibacter sp. G-1-2-2]|uniref:Tripartite tricarboxylate transporter substrate binding protein n=1 Tax=Ramlibacter agri TaxID=2728837 RepID=A0A848H0H4_9BURK|nr:tripartite tricarboxylate transporter substrate binding protein [Ramlibacter agri]NML44074.1 tripartite tricarboxylate transporter substrate binding protein [Ramlibacter agri]